jgi:Cu/Ag efflux pump CusA
VPQVQITDRKVAGALGPRADQFAETVDVASTGGRFSVLEDQRTYDVVVRFNDAARQSVETIASTLVDTPTGAKVPLSQVAEIRVDQGPNTINRENVQRRIIVQANVANRDLGSIIDEIRTKIARDVPLPEGYFVQYGGQFEAQEAAARQITIMSVVAIAGIFLLLYLALGSGRLALLVMANLPLALIGGVLMVFLSGGTLSIASLIGFITLFGIATQRDHADYPLPALDHGGGNRSVSQCSGILERLSPILMTAPLPGVGLIPLALGVGQPGKEIPAAHGRCFWRHRHQRS